MPVVVVALAGVAMADLTRTQPPPDKDAQAEGLQGMAAEADSVLSYGESMWSPDAPDDVHERVENSLKRAVGAYFLLGQLIAMPALLDRPAVKAAALSAPGLPLPGQPSFDPWCLTDPHTRASWKRDPAARRAIDTLWRYDPDPAATLAIQSQIDAAVADGSVTLDAAAGGQRMGNYYCCPWSAIYVARRPVTIAKWTLRAGQQFTFDVSAEEIAEGGQFIRRLLLGPFHPTKEVDYCDPTAEDDR